MAAYERTEHEKKYDRQMRLWGSHGQMNLETAHICCIGSGATASETLKNLVLPNVGRFTLIDDAVATAADHKNNFFVDLHSVGRPRAEAVTENLIELNAEVKGESVVKDPLTLLSSSDLSYFSKFSLVVVADPRLSVRSLLPLAAFLWTANIPLIVVSAQGLLGSARLQVREHAIVESHPGNDRYDLYVHPEQGQHWAELREYCESFKVFRDDAEAAVAAAAAVAPAASAADSGAASSGPAVAAAAASSSSSTSSVAAPTVAATDSEEHAHIPYIAILWQCVQRWLSTRGQLPRSYDEKKSFKQFIRDTAWSGEEGNFDEAIEFAHRAYELPKFDRYVQSVFDDPSASDPVSLCDPSSHFWLLVRAVRDFIAAEGKGSIYPVSQNLPDMHCKTAHYVTLKLIFQRKAAADLAAVRAHLRALESQLGLPAEHVGERELESFVRNIRTLRIIRTRSLADEYGADGTSAPAADGSGSSTFQTEALRELLEEAAEMEAAAAEDDAAASSMSDSPMGSGSAAAPKQRRPHNPSNVQWYLALRAADIFLSREGRAAGTGEGGAVATPAQLNADVRALQSIGEDLLRDIGLSDTLPSIDLSVLAETVRSAASEPHVTAAFMGGVASQMTLKLLLRQYVPLNNTLIWNGLFASSTTLCV